MDNNKNPIEQFLTPTLDPALLNLAIKQAIDKDPRVGFEMAFRLHMVDQLRAAAGLIATCAMQTAEADNARHSARDAAEAECNAKAARTPNGKGIRSEEF